MIADQDPDVLLVLSADHVYKLDYSTWSPTTSIPAQL